MHLPRSAPRLEAERYGVVEPTGADAERLRREIATVLGHELRQLAAPRAPRVRRRSARERLAERMTTDGLRAVVAQRPACRGSDLDFFPELDRLGEVAYWEAVYDVRQLCRSCPVRPECAELAIRTEDWGIWGGLTEADRQAERVERGLVDHDLEEAS